MNAPKPFENGYALLIGIRYGHWPENLDGPLKDVKALKDHFSDPSKAGYKSENIIELTEEKATTSGILAALDTLANKSAANPDATVIIYYSGHGGNFRDKYFLVPYDFHLTEWDAGNLNEEFIIQTTDFARKINNIEAKKCLIILDCCHAENIPVEKKISSSKKFISGFTEGLNEGIVNLPSEKSLTSQLNKGNGRVVLTSCEANETSLDLGSISLFTKILLECFNGTNNIEQDGWVRLLDLIRYVPKNVADGALKYDNHQQHPMFKRIENLSSEDFIICAYDIDKAKNLSPRKQKDPLQSYDTILSMIDAGNYPELFKVMDQMQIENQNQYNRFKREFSAGLKGIDLIDFGDRLKVFTIHQLSN
jgi:hypothetical protein